MRSAARVVVVGGGVVGASVLYHLTKAGWPDVMLIERFGASANAANPPVQLAVSNDWEKAEQQGS